MAIINHDLKAIYVRLPQNASTSIAHTLISNYNFNTFKFEHENHHQFIHDCHDSSFNSITGLTYITKHGNLRYILSSTNFNTIANMTLDNWRDYTKFTFVQNPYTHTVSAYLYCKKKIYETYNIYTKQAITIKDDIQTLQTKIVELTEILNNSDDISIRNDLADIIKMCDRNILEYNHILHELKYDPGIFCSSTLFDYLTFLLDVRNINSNLFCCAYMHSIISQSEHMLDADNNINFQFIGKVETINNDLSLILSKIGLNLFSDGPISRLNSNDKYNLYDIYDDRSITLVNKLFKDDFTNFGYTQYTNLTEMLNDETLFL